MLKRRSLWIVLTVVVLLAGTAAALQKKQAKAAQQAAALQAPASAVLEFLPSDVTTIQPRDLQQVLLISGSLRAVNQATIKARLAGEVREVLVREGEAVSAGQVLVRIDSSDYQARLEQAKGALQATRAQLAIATNTRDNNKTLQAKGFISQNAYDTTASQYDIADANVASAKGALDVAQKSLSDTVIRAPISGLVSSRSVQPGEKVSSDNRLLDIVDLRKLEMEAAIPSAEIVHIVLGQQVRIKVEGVADTLPGKVVRINPATQSGSRSVMTYIQLDNPDGALRAGMFAEARLTLAKKSNVLSVPPSALHTSAGNSSVYLIEQGKLLQQPVTLGERGDDGDGSAVEIVSGLAPGAQIVKINLGNLRSGTDVVFAKLPAAAVTK